jgi:outer membrane protein OmpA-like peptidoglycan-associated protein
MVFNVSGQERPGYRANHPVLFDTSKTITLSGTVTWRDTLTHQWRPMQNATVVLKDIVSEQKFSVLTDSKGSYKFIISKNKGYAVLAKKKGYINSNKEHIITNGLSSGVELKVDLFFRNDGCRFASSIYYEKGKADLSLESTNLIDSLMKIMVEFPYMVFEIGSHTDCRGSYAYNDSLSLARSNAVIDYLVRKGIDKKRLEPHGYGEHQLVNNCGCEPNNIGPGKDCTEEEHLANRRTTVKLLRTDYNLPHQKEKKDDDE